MPLRNPVSRCQGTRQPASFSSQPPGELAPIREAGPEPHVHTGLLKSPPASHQSSNGRCNLKVSISCRFPGHLLNGKAALGRGCWLLGCIFPSSFPNKRLGSLSSTPRILSYYWELSKEVIESSYRGDQ